MPETAPPVDDDHPDNTPPGTDTVTYDEAVGVAGDDHPDNQPGDEAAVEADLGGNHQDDVADDEISDDLLDLADTTEPDKDD